ncbi:MAG: hypothetical protein HY290_30415 [Planctomycetia bacterium]|nr:hypothetical protein [Planctomycetia bacterium]
MTRNRILVPAFFLLAATAPLIAEEAADQPKNVPATREEVKQALNNLRHRKPRLPLPAPTEEELKAARERAAAGGGAGGLGGGLVNNARMRALHLPEEPKTNTGFRPQANPQEGFSPSEKQVFQFTRKLTVAPQLIVDSDISRLREHFSDSEVAEIVHRVTTAAFFDRLTEAAGLQLED